MFTSSPGKTRRPLGYGQQFPGLAPILAPLPPSFPKQGRRNDIIKVIDENANDEDREAEVKIVAATLYSAASGRHQARVTLSKGGAVLKPLKSIIRRFPNSSSKIQVNRPRSVRTRIGIRTPGRVRIDTPLVSPYKVLPAIPKTADKKIVTWDEDVYMSVLTGNLDCNPEQEPSKMVRVFISTLYDDMEYERNYLFENAYPQLLSYCSDRDLEFKYVDLNLGVGGLEVVENCAPELMAHEIRECQRLSHGPAYVLLIGDTSGKELMPVFVDGGDLDTLHQIMKRENLDPEELVYSSYTKDDNNLPPRAVLSPVLDIHIDKEDADMNEVLGNIKGLILTQWAEQEPKLVQKLKKTLKFAVEGNIMEDEKAQTFVRTELEEDVKQAILTFNKAREQCLCYEKNAPKMLTMELNGLNDKTQGGTTGTHGTHGRTTYGQTSKTAVPKKTYTDLSNADRTTRMKMAVIEKLGMQNCGSFTTNAMTRDEVETDTEYLQEMTSKFVKDAKRMIDVADERHMAQEEATPLYQEALRHMRLCNRILDETVSNDESVLRVRHALFGDRDTANKPVVVYGGEECGKTCVLAKVANYARFWMGPDCVTIMRFLNISSESSNSVSLLRSIIDQITTVYGLEKPPDDPSRNCYKQGIQLRWLLDIVARTCRNPLMLVIDNIDALDDPDARKLSWFPNTTPGNDRVAIVTSVNSHQSKDILTELANILNSEKSMIKLDDTLSEITAEDTLNSFLDDHERALTYTQKDFFIDTFQKIPSGLFLKIWLERARTWKSYETPVLPTSDSNEALEDILIEFFARLQKNLGNNVAKYAAGYLTVSSHGLTEVELEDVLSCNNEVLQEVYQGISPPSTKAMRIPPLYVARFLHSLKNFLKEKYIDGTRVVTWMHESFPNIFLTVLPGIVPERFHADLAEIYENETDVVKNITLDNPPLVLKDVKRLVRPQPLTAKNVRKLASLPYHLLLKTPEMGDELHAVKTRLFNNLKWLMTKIEAFTIDGVLEDLQMALEFKSDDDTQELFEVLRQAGPIIRGDPKLLPIEVISRLKPLGSYEKLYNQCLDYIRDQDKAQLLPLYPCLPGTKEILVDSVPGCIKLMDALEDEGLVAIKGENGKVSVYSLETNEFTHHMENFPDPGQNVISFVSEDKQRMMSLIGTNLRVWNFKSGASIKEFEIDDEAMENGSDVEYTSLDVTKDGSTALLGTNKGGVVIVDTIYESVRLSDNVHAGKVTQAFYDYNYHKIVSVSEEDLIINVWLVKTLEVFKAITLPSKLIKAQTCYLMENERIICGCETYTVVIACIVTGDILYELPALTGLKRMTSLSIDDDFLTAITGGEDDVIRIWDLTAGKLDKEIPVFASNCTCVAITSDGEYGGAAFDNPLVMKIYHLGSGDCLKEIKALRDRVTSMGCVRYDHKTYLFSIFGNKIADLWDIANMFTKPAESPTIQKLKAEDHFDVNARMLGVEESLNPLRSPLPPKLLNVFPEASVDDVMISMVMTSSGDNIVTTSANSKPKVWDVMTGLLVREVKATGAVKEIRPCVVDTALVGMQELVNDYGTVYVLKMWDFLTGEQIDLDSQDEIYVSALSVSHDSMTAWVGNTSPVGPVIALSCFDLVEKRMLRHVVDDEHNLGYLDPVNISLKMHLAEVAPDGKIAITSSEDADNSHTYIHTVNLLDRRSPALRVACTGAKMADQIHVVTRNYEIITGTSKGEIVIWNGYYFHILRTLTEDGKDNVVGMTYLKYWDSDYKSPNAPHSGKIMDIRLTADERHLVAASKDKTITLWDMKCNALLRRLVGHEDEVWCADISLDTSLVISGSRDGSIRLWKFDTGEVLSKFMVRIDVFDVRITNDNKRIVARGDRSLTGKMFIFEILNLEKALAVKPATPVAREGTSMTLSRGGTQVSFKSTVSVEDLGES